MLTLDEMRAIVAQVNFRNFVFSVNHRAGVLFYLKATFIEADIVTGKPEIQHTRKWLLSEHMTKSEIVQTCFKLVTTAIEHSTREGFTYDGLRVYGPHFDVDALAELCSDRRFDCRKEATGG